MNKSTQLLLASLLVPCLYMHTKCMASIFDHMQSMMKEMDAMVHEMEAEFGRLHAIFDQRPDLLELLEEKEVGGDQQSTAKEMPRWHVNQDNSNVVITLENLDVDPDAMQTPVDAERLNITIPYNGQKIVIRVEKNARWRLALLSLETSREHQKNGDNNKASSYAYSSSNNQQAIPSDVELDKTQIEYNKDAKQLTITLPRKVAKRIPVTRK